MWRRLCGGGGGEGEGGWKQGDQKESTALVQAGDGRNSDRSGGDRACEKQSGFGWILNVESPRLAARLDVVCGLLLSWL